MSSIEKIITEALDKELKTKKSDDKKEDGPPLKNKQVSGNKTYESKIVVNGVSFKMKLDTNVNPSKKGIKIQFIKDGENSHSSSQQIDITTTLQNRLNDSLRTRGMEVDVDPDIPGDNIIGFTIRLDWFDKLIRNIFKDEKTSPDNKPAV